MVNTLCKHPEKIVFSVLKSKPPFPELLLSVSLIQEEVLLTAECKGRTFLLVTGLEIEAHL